MKIQSEENGMRKSQSLTIAGAQFSQSQVTSAGSIRLNKGDRVRVVGKFPGSLEMREGCGEITKHRGFGKFIVALDAGGEGTFDGTYLRKIPGQ